MESKKLSTSERLEQLSHEQKSCQKKCGMMRVLGEICRIKSKQGCGAKKTVRTHRVEIYILLTS